MVSGGLQKVEREIQISVNSGVEKRKRKYEDTFPDDLPDLETVQEKYGAVIWCKYTACQHNTDVGGLQRTSGTILKNRIFKPIVEQEHIWPSICTRGEIAINFDEIRTAGGKKTKVPSCFVAATNKTGHIDFSKFLNSDGSPLGGNIDSQAVSDAGYGALDSSNIYQE